MLFSLGQRAPRGDVIDLLIACHRRILEHLALARRLATAPPSTPVDHVRAAAARVHAYFAHAFPLHKLDEEEDIFPRLLGRDDELDAAIGMLLRDHDDHDREVAEIVAICDRLRQSPEQLHDDAECLAAATRALEDALVSHLALEERTVFPAIALMAGHERQEILDRMRARRDTALAS